jgi:hypothetical protein
MGQRCVRVESKAKTACPLDLVLRKSIVRHKPTTQESLEIFPPEILQEGLRRLSEPDTSYLKTDKLSDLIKD